MVYYFTSTASDPAAFLYVGKDKVESEYHSTELTVSKMEQMRI